jgi:hypothetical protein
MACSSSSRCKSRIAPWLSKQCSSRSRSAN